MDQSPRPWSFDPVERFLSVVRPAGTDEQLLPDWATYLIRLGAALAVAPRSASPLLSAIAVPARPFAAALVAVGAVLSRGPQSVSSDHLDHWKALQELVKRQGKVAVIYLSDTGPIRRTLIGFHPNSDPDWALLDAGGGVRSRVPAREALRIEPVEGHPKLRRYYARPQVTLTDAGLASAVIPDAALGDFVSRSRLDCLLVGNERTLREELLGERFIARRGNGESVFGRLQDIVRARSLLGDGQCFRSDLTSLASKDTRRKQSLAPSMVVFDGSAAFLKWQRFWRSAPAVAVLDRTDYRFDDATARIDELAIESASVLDTLVEIPSPPAGVELCMLKVPR